VPLELGTPKDTGRLDGLPDLPLPSIWRIDLVPARTYGRPHAIPPLKNAAVPWGGAD